MLYLVGVLLLLSCSMAKITINKFEPCEPNKDYEMQFTYTIKNENDMQVLEEFTFNTNVDMDDSIMGNVELFMFNDDKWNRLLTFRDNFCHVRNQYMPDLSEMFEKAAGLPESCPYSKGEYKISNFPLDFEKIDYSAVPRGQLLIKTTLFYADTDDILSCVNVEFTVED